MEIAAVKRQIKEKSTDNFYIFTGPEIAIQHIYIDKIAQCNNCEIQMLDSVSDIYTKKRTRSFTPTTYCYVIRDDKDFIKAEKAWDNITNMLGKNILIFLVTQVDKRGKFYKHFKDTMVEFNYLETPVLIRYIKKEIDLCDSDCKLLAEVCENDYSRILLEIDKIKIYKDYLDSKLISSSSFENAFHCLLDQGVIHQPPKDAIFELVDAILSRKLKLTFDLYEDCKAVGESPLVIQSVCYNQLKHLLQVQSCTSKDLSKSTGLSGWDIKLVKDKCGKYTNRELVDGMKLLRSVEKGIKTGEIDSDLAIDYALVNLL